MQKRRKNIETATERISVLLRIDEKRQIAEMAQDAGLSISEFFRQAAASFDAPRDDRLLDEAIIQLNKTASQASMAIDQALAFVEASNKRIAAMEAARTLPPKPLNHISGFYI